MTPLRRRRLIDRLLAGILAIVVVVIGLLVYRSSDIKNTSLLVSNPSNAAPGAWSAASVPSPNSAVPRSLTQKWSAPTDPALGAVASASGVVLTTEPRTVRARDAVTGVERWSYSRANRTLCAVGSADFGPSDMASSASVSGVTTVFSENGFCSQVMTFDPVDGTRGKVRTSANQGVGSLVFGGSYAGWLGPTRIEVWRYDLVRTIQYGEMANPPKPDQSRLGCTFTDMAIAGNQFATVEHCSNEANARLVLNFDDPGAVAGHPKDWDTFQHAVRVDIDTKAAAARIVGVSADRIAVLVSGPKPAVVVYDAAGKEASRTPVDIPAADIVAADSTARPATATPSVQTPDRRYSFVGNSVLSVSQATISVVPPPTSFSSSVAASSSTAATSNSGLLTALTAPKTVDTADLHVDWVAGDALGLPATIDATTLLPTAKGLATFDSATGPGALGTTGSKIVAVDRSGYAGRVDATAVGRMIIEDRGPTVVGLG